MKDAIMHKTKDGKLFVEQEEYTFEDNNKTYYLMCEDAPHYAKSEDLENLVIAVDYGIRQGETRTERNKIIVGLNTVGEPTIKYYKRFNWLETEIDCDDNMNWQDMFKNWCIKNNIIKEANGND